VSPDLVAGLEAILFASDTPVELARLAEVLEASPEEVRLALETLRAACDTPDRGLTVVEVGGGYRLVTRPEQAAALLRLQRLRLRSRLSRAALETLAIVAYRQPISRPEIEQLRGVSAESVVTHLLERRLVRMVGRKPTPGRPILYGTSREFLEHFGLRDLGELPAIEVPAAAAAALARAGLAAEAGAEPGAAATAAPTEEDGHPAGA
jgi:segregation and condensation protein B